MEAAIAGRDAAKAREAGQREWAEQRVAERDAWKDRAEKAEKALTEAKTDNIRLIRERGDRDSLIGLREDTIKALVKERDEAHIEVVNLKKCCDKTARDRDAAREQRDEALAKTAEKLGCSANLENILHTLEELLINRDFLNAEEIRLIKERDEWKAAAKCSGEQTANPNAGNVEFRSRYEDGGSFMLTLTPADVAKILAEAVKVWWPKPPGSP
jgi:hypothetical protein